MKLVQDEFQRGFSASILFKPNQIRPRTHGDTQGFLSNFADFADQQLMLNCSPWIESCQKGLGRHKSSGFSGPGFPQPESENSLIGQKLHQRSTHDREDFIRIMIG